MYGLLTQLGGRTSRLERLLPELARMVIQMLPHEDHLSLLMTSRTMYTQLPSLPSTTMTRVEHLVMHRNFESQMRHRKLLSLVCTSCTKLKALEEFSDYQRHQSRSRGSLIDRRLCISCLLDTTWFNKGEFLHCGVASFGCFGCKKGLPLVSFVERNFAFLRCC